jgi:hypothetical protein
MKLFKSKTLQWWNLGIIKFAVACLGVAVGAHWQRIFRFHVHLLIILGLIAGLYSLYIWIKD